MDGMINYTRNKLEKSKVLKKLVAKWGAAQDTKKKAAIIMAKNPEIKSSKRTESRKIA